MDQAVSRAAIVIVASVAMATAITWLGCFDSVMTEVGFQYYGEPPNHSVPFLPAWLKMPANTLVNLGYCLLGLAWLRKFSNDCNNGAITNRDLFMGAVFSWLIVVYGPVQFLRIVTQQHRFAVMDQWITLPFFSWPVVMMDYLLHKWNTKKTVAIMAVSLASYSFALVHDVGFEVALGGHILLAVLYGVRILKASQWKMLRSELLFPFTMAVVSCAGFVGLKLLDLHLAQFSVFQRFSGHFWSKVADLSSEHFVLRLLHPIMVENARNKKLTLFKAEELSTEPELSPAPIPIPAAQFPLEEKPKYYDE